MYTQALMNAHTTHIQELKTYVNKNSKRQIFIAASFTIAQTQCSQIYEELYSSQTTEYNPLVKRNASQKTEKLCKIMEASP